MIEPRFKIGDKAWRATFHPVEKVWETCPDCLGDKRLTVILGSGEHVHIECECCRFGYEGSAGKVDRYAAGEPRAEQITIGGMEVGPEGVRYRYNIISGGWSNADEGDLFATPEEAQAAAEEKAVEYNQEQQDALSRKVKRDKNWAWHVHYHRREMKHHREKAEYHAAALGIAKDKAKEQEPTQ